MYVEGLTMTHGRPRFRTSFQNGLFGQKLDRFYMCRSCRPASQACSSDRVPPRKAAQRDGTCVNDAPDARGQSGRPARALSMLIRMVRYDAVWEPKDGNPLRRETGVAAFKRPGVESGLVKIASTMSHIFNSSRLRWSLFGRARTRRRCPLSRSTQATAALTKPVAPVMKVSGSSS